MKRIQSFPGFDLKSVGFAAICWSLFSMFCLAASASAACSCQNMVLQIANQSNIFCGAFEGQPEILDAPGCAALSEEPGTDGCPEDKFAYQCPLGRFNPQAEAEFKVMGFTFQTIITLNEGSTASECTTGQYVAGIPLINGAPLELEAAEQPPGGENDLGENLTVNGLVAPANFPALPDPPDSNDPTMGADGYTGTGELDEFRMRFPADTQQIWMIDAPQDQIEGMNDSLDQNFLFVSWVKGTDEENSCWCRFSLVQTWQDEMPGGPGIALVGDNNDCMLAAE